MHPCTMPVRSGQCLLHRNVWGQVCLSALSHPGGENQGTIGAPVLALFAPGRREDGLSPPPWQRQKRQQQRKRCGAQCVWGKE